MLDLGRILWLLSRRVRTTPPTSLSSTDHIFPCSFDIAYHAWIEDVEVRQSRVVRERRRIRVERVKTNYTNIITVRVIGFALYLAIKSPSKSVVIAEFTLQSVGLTPLLLELSFTLLRW